MKVQRCGCINVYNMVYICRIIAAGIGEARIEYIMCDRESYNYGCGSFELYNRKGVLYNSPIYGQVPS